MKELKIPKKHTEICDNCRGNGFIKVVNNNRQTNVHQCWICKSEGEIKNYDQAEVDDFIYDFYYRKQLH